MLDDKKALLLDMNGTFMFGAERFGEFEDYSNYYNGVEGTLEGATVNSIVQAAYRYLALRYSDEAYRHCFPSVESTIHAVLDTPTDSDEIGRLVATFAFHERGAISETHAAILTDLPQLWECISKNGGVA